jgi:putative ABC transport system substrate-binding protein
MRRRDLITLLGGAAAWPLVAARAQQQAIPVIGFVRAGTADDSAGSVAAFRKGLGETGFVEGQNGTVEYHRLEGQDDRLPALIRRRMAVIVAIGSTTALAAKAATTTIPIVFTTNANPVALGLVASLNRPGGNVTGHTIQTAELAPKQLQLLRELMPNAARFGVLVDPTAETTPFVITDLQGAARTLGLQLIVVSVRTDSDLEMAFATLSQQHVGAVLVGTGNLFPRRMEQLALAARYALPAIYPYREYVLAGGLMSYGSSVGYLWHQAGIYAGRILKGDKPADLPVQQVTKLDLVINLKTAKALALTIPETLLATADEVIQ